MKKSRAANAKTKPASKVASGRFDIEALGLVVLAVGIFMAGVLLPMIPSGELGRGVREAQTLRIGWAAYALPLPLLVLGALFMLRRNPRWWPRALAGYLLLLTGAWGVTVALATPITGSWGAALRASVAGNWGMLAAVPAVVIASVGIDLLLGWPPTRLLRSALLSVITGIKRAWSWFSRNRRAWRHRAAFRADVALVRKALLDLSADLEALSSLYPGSGELERWQAEVLGSRKQLSDADQDTLREVRADLKAWQGAVTGFSKDRALELSAQLEREEARAPEEGATTFEAWSTTLGRVLADPLAGHGRAADALDRVRKSLALDLVAVLERQKRLSRDRDLDRRNLRRMVPRQLAQAYKAHQARLLEIRDIETDAAALLEHAEQFEAWRPLIGRLGEALTDYPQHEELADYNATLAKELSDKDRDLLLQDVGWSDALTAVVQRAERDHQLALEEQRKAQERAAEARREAERVAAEQEWATDQADDGTLAYPHQDADEISLPGSEAAVYASEARPGSAATALNPQVERALLDEVVAPGRTPAPVAVEPRPAPAVNKAPGRAADGPAPENKPLPAVGAIPVQLPRLDLLDELPEPSFDRHEMEREHKNRVRQIDETLASFNLNGRVVASVRGPTVTRFEVEPAPGEKISRFSNLSDDLALAMAVGSVRIEAPIPGKSVIGLEVPNAYREAVYFREAVSSPDFRRSKARMPIVLGRAIEGDMKVGDLTRMPHLLIAGSTGSGKSVAVNTLICSLLFRFLPTELRFLMIDPKMVELTPYDGIPHLIRPVVTNPADAAGVLLGAVAHMERRYKMMSKIGAKNLDQYNEKAVNLDMPALPFIVIIIDELADLMITSPKEVESAIMRLAQMARATGMHLILATQRPSVDILTSLIKVNVPARMAFAVSSSHDSRTILDSMGAERLTGRGDMLFYQPGLAKAVRLQGPFLKENETARLGDFMRRQYFDDDFVEAYGDDFEPVSPDESSASGLIDWNDEKLRVAADLVVNEGQASVSRLQRRLSVGHARAGKLMDSLEGLGVVGAHQGSKPRDVLVSVDELPEIFGR